MSTPKGDRFKMDEIAYQQWNGEKIAAERCFYDPAQRQPLPTSG